MNNNKLIRTYIEENKLEKLSCLLNKLNINGLELYNILLNKLLNKDIDYSKYMNNQEINSEKLYKELYILIKNNQFVTAKYKIYELKKINFNINFEYINTLIDLNINKIKRELPVILARKDYYLKNNETKEYYNLVNILYGIRYSKLDLYLIDCNYMLENSITEGTNYLEKLKKIDKNNEYNLHFKYLENKKNEINHKNKNDETMNKFIEYYKYKIKKSLEENDLDYALFSCFIAHDITKDNIFNYYMGKIFYKMKKHELSKKYILEYIKYGTEKLPKAVLYICLCNKHLNLINQNQKIIEKYSKLNIFDSFDYDINSLISYKKSKELYKRSYKI